MAIEAKPEELNLFYEPKDRLRLTVRDERSYITVRPAWASPLSHPNRFLAFLDGKGDEILTLDEPEELSTASLQAVREELRRRYLTATVTVVEFAKVEFGATYWHVDTDRGPRDFVTQSLQENAQWLSPDHLLLIDVDGNRFEIPSVSALDLRSRGFIERIL
ncbi:MAG: DUF1854 domain-containing protein [Fimbriimonadaceae bacterium]|nr:DUF1854 domain-containing protein [Fimbriimonadaceae bacterium]